MSKAARSRHGQAGSFTPIDEPLEPQRHGGHREGTEPIHPHRNHEDSKTRRNHEGHPPARKRKGAKTQSPPTPAPAQRRCSEPRELSGVPRLPAVGRPETAVSGLRVEPERSPWSPAPAARALGERRPRHFSPSFKRMQKGPSLRLTMGRARGRTAVARARRPVRSAATTNARVRSPPASYRRQAIRSPAVLPSRGGRAPMRGTRPFASLRSIGRVGGLRDFFVSWCLRGCDVGGWALCPLCVLCASVVQAGGRKFEIRNSKSARAHLTDPEISPTFEPQTRFRTGNRIRGR